MSAVVKLAERPGRPLDGRRDEDGGAAPQPSMGPGVTDPVGLAVRDLHRDDVARLDLPEDVRGVMISRVEPLSPAFDADLERGQVVLEVNRRKIASAAEFRRILAAARDGEVLTLYVYLPALDQRILRTVRVHLP